MKRVYSISLNEKLMDSLDRYCVKSGLTRSEVISKLLVDYVNNGINPDEVENDDISERKSELLNTIYDLYFSISEFKNFSSRFAIKMEQVEESSSILFEFSNKKFYCEMKVLDDSVKINARYKSSSNRMQEIFENAYIKHKAELEEQGFKREIYQRFWDIEYKYPVQEYPSGNEVKLLARYLLKKLFILFIHFFIELDFIINGSEAEELIETSPLYKSPEVSDEGIPPYLQVMIGANIGIKYQISSNSSTTIGRYNTEINLLEQELDKDMPVVSKQHAQLLWRADKLYITDLGSMNGTSINGQIISEQDRKKGKEYELKDGDRILIADIELKVVL
ncbi:FHA domain-containing protein [Lutispora sp.]|uniref:FHA domain-containing protein n=1 Tax=Lutispora sp. TaxID=2828727 RepID=UPI0035647FA1